MNKALIGFSGFVGGTLLKQTSFDELYRSTNITQIRGKSFELVVCAGAPGKKWRANKYPGEDRQCIESLIDNLKTIECDKLILISTVDVFSSPNAVDESTAIDEQHLHAYGLNRRSLEKFVEGHFSSNLIVRLPGLVGPGLKKNSLFDLHNDNYSQIDSRSIFQFYPMVSLWSDITLALRAGLKLVHLTSAPLSVADAAKEGFGREFSQILATPPLAYDMKTLYASAFGSQGDYQYSVREIIQAIRAYAQSEPKTLIKHPGGGIA